MVDIDVIPLLRSAHKCAISTAPGEPAAPAAADIAKFAELVITRDTAAVTTHVASLLDRGMTIEAVALGLLTPTARFLGALWEQDLVYFTDVAVGLTRLQHAMTSIGASNLSSAPNPARQRRALLISMRGEMHNFGLFMVANFFRRANWEVNSQPLVTSGELTAAVSGAWFDLVGISVSSLDQLDCARTAIGLIRAVSCNKTVKILAGGRYFIDNAGAALEIGADGASTDALQAVDAANRLVEDARSDCPGKHA